MPPIISVSCSGIQRDSRRIHVDPNRPASLGEAVGFVPGARDQRAFESHGEDVALFTTVASLHAHPTPTCCAPLSDFSVLGPWLVAGCAGCAGRVDRDGSCGAVCHDYWSSTSSVQVDDAIGRNLSVLVAV
eukprot:COSAG02_NODE_13616_length_1372_cov_1.004713_1_plen_131_part_00